MSNVVSCLEVNTNYRPTLYFIFYCKIILNILNININRCGNVLVLFLLSSHWSAFEALLLSIREYRVSTNDNSDNLIITFWILENDHPLNFYPIYY